MLSLRSGKEITGAEGSFRLPRLWQNEGSHWERTLKEGASHGWKTSKIPLEPCRDIPLVGSVCPE